MVRVFTNGLGDWGSIPSRVIPKTEKMVLILLNTQHYKVRVKWSTSGKGVAPSTETSGHPQLRSLTLLFNSRISFCST